MEEFDEEDDIILPDTVRGEILYIIYVLKTILTDKTGRENLFAKLRRQIYFFIRWMKNK